MTQKKSMLKRNWKSMETSDINGLIREWEKNTAIYKEKYGITTKTVSCITGTFKVEVSILVDDYPLDTNWGLADFETNTFFFSTATQYFEPNRLYKHEFCLTYAKYIFVIGDTGYDGLCSPYNDHCGFYQVALNGEIILKRSAFAGYFTETFTICSSDEECNDFNSCTIDTCVLNSCRNDLMSCVECNGMEVKVEVKTDLSPFLYSWSFYSSNSYDLLWSGGPYEFPDHLYVEEFCIPRGHSTFNMTNFAGVHMCYLDIGCGYFNLYVDGELTATTQYLLNIESVDTMLPEYHYLTKWWYDIIVTFPKQHFCDHDSDCETNHPCKIDYCDLASRKCSSKTSAFISETCPQFGNRTALVFRIVALDSETTPSITQLTDAFFGTQGNNFTMKSQLQSCSYNELKINSFSGASPSGVLIVNGAVEIQIQQNIIGLSSGTVVDTILLEATKVLGDIESRVDFLVICVPPGTTIGTSQNWKAYAFVNSYLSIYNDANCLYPSVQIHEIGHNLGLSHSNDENKNYGDESGYMGISYSQKKGPRKCFNSVKSWQLGWYHESHLVVDAKELKYYNDNAGYHIVAMVDYKRRQLKNTIIKLINAAEGFDYYISYNRQTGINSGPSEEGNKVLITKRRSGIYYDDSILVAAISDQANFFEIINRQLKEKVKISPIFFLDRSPPFVDIWMVKADYALAFICTNDAECEDNDQCTIDSCNVFSFHYFLGKTKNCNYTKLDCKDCGSIVSVQLLANEKPKEIYWDIINTKSGDVVFSSQSYEAATSYIDNECLAFGKYVFSFYYSTNSSSTDDPVEFNLYLGESLIDSDVIFHESYLESFFIVCATDNDCRDYDGCSVDICDQEANTCNNTFSTNKQSCQDCAWVSLNITFDNYIDETTWGIYNIDLNDFIITGDPYSYDISRVYGRRKGDTKAGRRKGDSRAGRRKGDTRAGMKRDFIAQYVAMNNDFEKIHESICLENNVLYKFLIEDSFGDGICCAEGEGSLLLRIGNKTVLTGGDFKDYKDLVFKMSQCISNEQCDDNNFCTEDICDKEISTCFYITKPCEECGARIIIDVFSDINPGTITWSVTYNSTVVVSGGPYPVSFSAFTTTKCLPFGSYEFHTKNFAYIGMIYCFHGFRCGYNITLKDSLVIESDGITGAQATYQFGICEADFHCNDGDKCTIDRCDYERRVCIFEENCAICGKSLVQVQFYEATVPEGTFWTVTSLNDSKIEMKGGPYLFYKYYATYYETKCLAPGNYVFTLESSALGECYDGNICGYSISIDGIVIYESLGGYQYFHWNSYYFDIPELTSMPSISLIPSNSLHPSYSPSNFPSNNNEIGQWDLVFKNVTKDGNGSSLLQSLVIEYGVSKNKLSSQIITTILDRNCSKTVRDSPLLVENVEINQIPGEALDGLMITVKVNLNRIQNSSIWESISKTSGLMSFCVRTELILYPDMISVSFLETNIIFNVDLSAAIIMADKASLERVGSTKVEKDVKLQVSACICDSIDNTCTFPPNIVQNSIIYICVFPLTAGFELSSFKSLKMIQGDGVKTYSPIVDGEINSLTKVNTGKIGIVRTQMISKFFEPDSFPLSVRILGEATLELIRENNRHLQGAEAQIQQRKEKNRVNFQIIIELSAIVLQNNYQISKRTFAFGVIFGVGITIIITLITSRLFLRDTGYTIIPKNE